MDEQYVPAPQQVLGWVHFVEMSNTRANKAANVNRYVFVLAFASPDS